MSSSTRSLNGLSGNTTTNVYVNTIDVFEGTLPVVVAQTSANQPVNISLKGISSFGGANKILKINSSNNALIWADDTTESITVSLPLERNGDVISLKGLSSMGTAGKIIKVNSGGTALEYADEDGSNWTRTQGGLGTVGYIQPAVSTDRVSIPPNSDIVFDNSPVDTDGFVLAHDTTNNAFTIKEKDGTLLLKLNANNMNVEWGTQGFMDFKGKALHGSNAEYPLGQNIGVGTIGLIFIATAYIKLITTNEILFNNYNASPFSIQSSIRLNDSGELYNTQGKWKGDTFYVDTNVDMLNNSSIMFRETTANGNHRINLIGQSSLSGDFTITLPATNGTVALTSDIPSDFIQSVSSPLAVSSNNLTLGTVPYNKGGTGLTSYTEGDLLYGSADNVLAKLPHGSGGDILRMNGTGTLPEWRTMYGATSPIVLTGGTTFELTTIPVNKGGTGFTGCNAGDMIYSLVANTLTKLNIGSTGQVLKVSGGLPVWSAETDTTYTGTGNIDITGTTISLTGIVPVANGGTNFNTYTVGDILYCDTSNTLSKLPIGTTGQLLSVASGKPSWGTFTGGTKWSVFTYTYGGQSQEVIYPTTSTQRVAIGYTTNPDDRRLYVNGDMEADLIFCDEMKNQNGANLVQQNASGYTMFGHDAGDMYLKCDDHFYLRQNGNTTSMLIKNNGGTASSGANRATDGIYLYLEYFCANISSHFNPNGGRAIGFTSYLNGSYVNNNFPCIATQYVNLYISVDNDSMVSGDRSGAYYAAYFNRYGLNGGSDGRLKKDVETITNAMDIIRQLRGVYFEWNDRPPEATRQTGFIAQEVNEVFPEIGDYDSATDKWALRYEKIAGLYAEGFKELDKENTELKEKVSTLETELTTYKSIVDKLINATSFKAFKESLA